VVKRYEITELKIGTEMLVGKDQGKRKGRLYIDLYRRTHRRTSRSLMTGDVQMRKE